MKLFQQIAFTLISKRRSDGRRRRRDKTTIFSPTHISVASTKLMTTPEMSCWTNLKQSREYLDEQLKLNGYEHWRTQRIRLVQSRMDICKSHLHKNA